MYVSLEGLIKMTAIATKNSNVSEVIAEIVWKVQAKGVRTYVHSMSLLLISLSSFRVMCGKCIRTLQAIFYRLPVAMYQDGTNTIL